MNNPSYKTIKVEQVFRLLDAIDELCNQHIKYPINIAYKLIQFKNQLNDIEKYTLDRIVGIIPNIADGAVDLNADENLLYQSIMASEIEISDFGLTKGDIFCTNDTNSGEKPTIDLDKCTILMDIF